MTSSTLAKLKAWGAGAPTQIGVTLPWPRAKDDDVLVLAFVRMAGESSPWGVAIGSPAGEPEYFNVPEPRNIDGHARFVRTFGRKILEHVLHPLVLTDGERAELLGNRDRLSELASKKQLWVPGPTHLDMLHFLDYRYTLARTGDEQHLRELRTVGRACGWLFRESQRPGQIRVFDATARLRQVFVFPAEAPRQSHLGFLMAWLTNQGSLGDRMTAAAAAERLSIGITMDPELERDELEDLVSTWNAAQARLTEALAVAAAEARPDPVAERTAAAEAAERIHAVLVPELERRWGLTVAAFRMLRDDLRPENSQLGLVVKLANEEFVKEFWGDEARAYDVSLPPDKRRPNGRHPETDWSPAQAAHRYFMHLHAHELANAELVHGDQALVEQAIDTGSAFRGTVISVVNESTGKDIKAVWRMKGAADDSLRLREDSKVCLVGGRKRVGRIRSIETEGDARVMVVEIVDGVSRRSVPDNLDAHDPAIVGREVIWLDGSGAGLSYQKTFKLGSSGPGAWLTHSTPAPLPSPPGPVLPDLLGFVESLK